MIDLQTMSAAECRNIIDATRVRLAELAGEPLCLEEHGEVYQDYPDYGAVLEQKWATDTHESVYWCVYWYPTEDAAMAALHGLADARGRVVDGRHVDLTVTGCYPSHAEVQVLC